MVAVNEIGWVALLVAILAVGPMALIVVALNRWRQTRRQRVRELVRLRRNENRFRQLIDRSSDVILILDANSRILFANPAAHHVLGYPVLDLVGKPLFDLIHKSDRSGAEELLATVSGTQKETSSTVWRLRHADGSWRHVESAAARLNEDRDGGSIILNSRDISDRVRLEAKLAHQAFHDGLTGLANRALFRDRVEHALARQGRHRSGLAVIFLDLDDFKTINDSLGHATGDRLLGSVASRLLNATRGCDTVARLGGDEFAVLLDNVPRLEDAIVVVERITAAFQIPFLLNGRQVRISASIGVATASAGESAGEILRNADLAMYRAKRSGKGGYEVFAPEMHTELVDQLELEEDLRAAVEALAHGSSQFFLVYQPIVELASERVIGVEALVRWAHPERGTIPPAHFIPLAEQSGHITELGRWILREACREVAGWPTSDASTDSEQSHHGPEPAVTVNLSGSQLKDPELVDIVAAALHSSGLAPERLVLEITESIVMQDTEPILETLGRLRDLGLRLAIDDFGTGYSSLSYLQKFPVDILKIDKSFVEESRKAATALP